MDYLGLFSHGQHYQIVTPEAYPLPCAPLADGQSHVELQRDLAWLEPGRRVAVGVHPFDLSDTEFEELYGAAAQRLWFSVRKNLNTYAALAQNPARYQAALAAWLG